MVYEDGQEEEEEGSYFSRLELQSLVLGA